MGLADKAEELAAERAAQVAQRRTNDAKDAARHAEALATQSSLLEEFLAEATRSSPAQSRVEPLYRFVSERAQRAPRIKPGWFGTNAVQAKGITGRVDFEFELVTFGWKIFEAEETSDMGFTTVRSTTCVSPHGLVFECVPVEIPTLIRHDDYSVYDETSFAIGAWRPSREASTRYLERDLFESVELLKVHSSGPQPGTTASVVATGTEPVTLRNAALLPEHRYFGLEARLIDFLTPVA